MPPQYKEPIQLISTKMDKEWKQHSLPFEDGGWRICRSDRYGDLMHKINLLACERRQAVDDMINHHGDVVRYAQNALGKAFNPDMIPDTCKMSKQFYSWLRAKPIPVADQARALHASPETIAQIEEQLGEALKQGEETMRTFARESVGKFVTELIAKLDNFSRGDRTRYGALLSSLEKAAMQLRETGLFPDELNALLQRAITVGQTDSERIRNSGYARGAVRTELSSIQAAIEAAF